MCINVHVCGVCVGVGGCACVCVWCVVCVCVQCVSGVSVVYCVFVHGESEYNKSIIFLTMYSMKM